MFCACAPVGLYFFFFQQNSGHLKIGLTYVLIKKITETKENFQPTRLRLQTTSNNNNKKNKPKTSPGRWLYAHTTKAMTNASK